MSMWPPIRWSKPSKRHVDEDAWLLPHPSAHIRLTMLTMGFPVLPVLRGQGRITDDEQIFRVLLLGRLRKVKAPMMTVSPSMTITLLWAIACSASIIVGTPWFARKSAEEYFSVRWLLSRMTWTWMPRLCASSRALAIGAEVKE
jgi:hypothetical protein